MYTIHKLTAAKDVVTQVNHRTFYWLFYPEFGI